MDLHWWWTCPRWIWCLYCKKHGCLVWLHMYAECDIALFLQKKIKKKYSKKNKNKKKKSSDESVGVKQRNLWEFMYGQPCSWLRMDSHGFIVGISLVCVCYGKYRMCSSFSLSTYLNPCSLATLQAVKVLFDRCFDWIY